MKHKVTYLGKVLILMILICSGLYSSAQQTTEKASIPASTSKEIIKTFTLLRNHGVRDTSVMAGLFIKIDTSTIKLINDQWLAEMVPHVKFYYLEIITGEYEYNLGRVRAIAAIPDREKNNIRLLLPLNYCCKPENFLKLFMGVQMAGNVDEKCKSIVNLFIHSTNSTADCFNESENIKEVTTSKDNRLVVNVSYNSNCWEAANSDKKTTPVQTIGRDFVFTFNSDTLKSVDYSDWKK